LRFDVFLQFFHSKGKCALTTLLWIGFCPCPEFSLYNWQLLKKSWTSLLRIVVIVPAKLEDETMFRFMSDLSVERKILSTNTVFHKTQTGLV